MRWTLPTRALIRYSYFEDQRQYSALEALKTCTKPKLFLYGKQDVLVSQGEVEKAYQASAESKQIHALAWIIHLAPTEYPSKR